MAISPKPSKYYARSSNIGNSVVDLISGIEQTIRQTGVDPKPFFAPYNADDLYQKAGDYSIYEEMMRDDQISTAMQIKKDLIIGTGWMIEANDEQIEIKEFLENSLEEETEVMLENAIREIMTADEYGFSVTEKIFSINDAGLIYLKDLRTRDPVSWLFHQDVYGNVTRYEQQGASNEFANIDPACLIHFINRPKFQNPYGTSDLRAAYMAYFIKTQVVKYFAIFLEKFASPMPVGRYDHDALSPDDALVSKVFNILKNMQTSTAAVIPKIFEIDFIEKNGNGDVYTAAINLLNMFIGRALMIPDLLGFQGSETGGGSYSLGTEQIKIFLMHIYAKRREIERVINRHIIKPLVELNFGEIEGKCPKFKFKPIDEKSAVEFAKLWLDYMGKGIAKPSLEEINYFKNTIQFPPTSEDDWEEQNQEQDQQQEQQQEKSDQQNEDETKNESGDQQEETDKFAKVYDAPEGSYSKRVNFKAIEQQMDADLAATLSTMRPIISKSIGTLVDKIKKINVSKPADADKLDRLTVGTANINAFARALNKVLQAAYDRGYDHAGNEIERAATFAYKGNKKFRKTIETENYNFVNDWEYNLTKKARQDVIAAIKDGTPINSVIDKVTTYLENDTAVQLERYARTKFTEVINNARVEYFNDTGVVDAYQYSAVLDDRTSDICAGLHGKIFKAGDEPVPPLHFNCRSILVPITKYEDYKVDTKVGSKPIDTFIEENIGKGFAKK